MEVDLNREPLYQIEERIRRLDTVICRAKQRERWQQGRTPIQITNFLGELVSTDDIQDEGRVQEGEVGVDVEEEIVEGGKLGKRKATYLIAKALGGTYTNEAVGCKGNFFGCNICLDTARHPVLTCCGHLFCWPCFYKVSYAYGNSKECPVCKGEVTEEGIIPIYGNASFDISGQLELSETGLGVPARPRARRLENIEERFRNGGISSVAAFLVD